MKRVLLIIQSLLKANQEEKSSSDGVIEGKGHKKKITNKL